MNVWDGTEHMGFMWIWWIIGIVLIVTIIWTLANPLGGRDGNNEPTAEEILKRRYASGDIDKEEYQRRLRDLRQ